MNDTTDAAVLLAPLRRRWWLILLVGVLVAGGTLLYYRHQPSVYAANTQLYFSNASEQQGVLNTTLGKTGLSATEIADQATLINSTIGEAVHRRLHAEHRLAAARGKAHAKSSSGSNFVGITAEAHVPGAAALLANDYAQAYIKQHEEGYRRAVRAAIVTTRDQLRRLEAAQEAQPSAPRGSRRSRSSGRTAGVGSGVATLEVTTLSARINQLESDLSFSSVQQVGRARAATAQLVSPAPKHNAIFGLVIGLALAALAVYAMERLRGRLHSLADIEAVLQTTLLAALPKVPQPLVRRDGEPHPAAALLEPLRGLHTSLQLGDMLERDRGTAPRVILFLGADAGDGCSTLVANLATVQRDTGARVAVIEADMRRPTLARLLAADSPRGLAEVLTGGVTYEGAMQSVGSIEPDVGIDATPPIGGGPAQPLGVDPRRSLGAVSTVARPALHSGSLTLLAGGGSAANPPALLASPAMRELVRAAATDYDYVLIDAPSLQVSDALPLLRVVDGIVIVARLEHTRAASAERLTHVLSRSATAPVLGAVANSVPRAEIAKHGFPSAHRERRWPRLI